MRRSFSSPPEAVRHGAPAGRRRSALRHQLPSGFAALPPPRIGNSTLADLPGDHLSLTRAGLQLLGHSARRALTAQIPPRAGTLTSGSALTKDIPGGRGPT